MEHSEKLWPSSQDTVIEKAGFNAFYGTALNQQLRREGITDLIVCGVTTECCVQSTLRDAVDHGYRARRVGRWIGNHIPPGRIADK